MSQPFSRLPDPEIPRPFKRRPQSTVIQEALQSALLKAQQYAQEARRFGEDLWRRGKRQPRVLAMIGGATAITLVGAYALSASSGSERSLCPPVTKASRKTPSFLVLMDPVPPPTAGSEIEIHYDVCGLPSGTSYRGRVQLSQQQTVAKKKKKNAPKPKPVVVSTFQGKVDGMATRRSQDVELGGTKPGTYTIELSVVDNRGRERKRLQKLVVRPE
jgi:hypothetical protein